MNTNLDKLIVIGDRVLIKPAAPSEKTPTGLFLPAGYQQKEEIQTGYIVKHGPGYQLPSINEDVESWKPQKNELHFMPLQVKVGDMAIFLKKGSIEIEYEKEKYYIVPQGSILLIEREEF